MQVFSFFVEDQTPRLIEVEYHSRFQIPSFQILGLPAPEIQEARERIVASFQASEFEFPKKKIVVNLSPSSIRKSGTGHDLAIAMKILESTIEDSWPEQLLAWGELSLDGSVKSVGRMAGLIELLLQIELKTTLFILLSFEDYQNLQHLLSWRRTQNLPLPEQCEFRSVACLKDSIEALKNTPSPLQKNILPLNENCFPIHLLPLAPALERILQLSLIGRHHLLLLGPKGIGKSESIHWCENLLPNADPLQVWERILSLESRALDPEFNPPIRKVHAQVRPSHLLGTFGAKGFQAGELALAHGGLLIADEFLEWPRDSKECLREPLQTERVTVTRVKGKVESKCEIQLIATSNLCPCGGLPKQFRSHEQSKASACRCRPNEIQDYFKKVSGPILDRIDLVAIMSKTPKLQRKMMEKEPSLQFQRMKQSSHSGRLFAVKNFGALPSKLAPLWLEENLPDDPVIDSLLQDIKSLRARHKILRVARSIQALEQSRVLKSEHVFESKSYRFMDTLME